MSAATKKVIPADVYDALELSALAFDGIGAGSIIGDDASPYCLIGHIEYVGPTLQEEFALSAAVRSTSGQIAVPNDKAVRAINVRKGAPVDARVSFEEYVAERGWERGS